MRVRILVGDCLERLRTLPEESVHCVVTSPPYCGAIWDRHECLWPEVLAPAVRGIAEDLMDHQDFDLACEHLRPRPFFGLTFAGPLRSAAGSVDPTKQKGV